MSHQDTLSFLMFISKDKQHTQTSISVSAFEKLFKSHYPRLFGYAIRYVNDPETAKDIIQECFLNLWERREKIENTAVTSYLFTLVRNSCLNYIKHLVIINEYKMSYLSKADGDERLYYWDFGLSADTPMLYDELNKEINHVIENLPDRCKLVFRMSRFQEMKNREIAEKLEISTTAVEKHIAKAISLLKSHFDNHVGYDAIKITRKSMSSGFKSTGKLE